MLEQSFSIGKKNLNTRLAMAPVDMQMSDHGTVSDAQVEYYDERTKGGCVGLVILEHSFVRVDGKVMENQLSCAKDEDIEGLKRLGEAIHANGSRVVAQISHAGFKSLYYDDGLEGISPSGSPEMENPETYRKTHAMTVAEIDALVEAFRQAARRVKAAGLDGVELHGAHGYLLNQFYSPLSNHRKDDYGPDSIENRVRLHLRILKAVREELGQDLLVGIRFGAYDYKENGSTIEDGVAAAKLLEAAGADFIDVSGGFCGSRPLDRKFPGVFSDSSSAIKAAVSVPVLTAGRIKTREDAEKLLAEGATDMISVGRAIVKDPEWARNALKC